MAENMIERLYRTRTTLSTQCRCKRKGFCDFCIGVADIDHLVEVVKNLRDGLQALIAEKGVADD